MPSPVRSATGAEEAAYGNLVAADYDLGQVSKAIELHEKKFTIARDVGDSSTYSSLRIL